MARYADQFPRRQRRGPIIGAIGLPAVFALMALIGLGAALSTILASAIAKEGGYGATVICLAIVAMLTFIFFAASLSAFRPYTSPPPAPV